jgi:ankyrin repeat protein
MDVRYMKGYPDQNNNTTNVDLIILDEFELLLQKKATIEEIRLIINGLAKKELLDYQDPRGNDWWLKKRTVLHKALDAKRLDVVKCLLEAGANPLIMNALGINALYNALSFTARLSSAPELLKELLAVLGMMIEKNPAVLMNKPEGGGGNGKSPLFLMGEQGQLEIFEFLLAKGAYLREKDIFEKVTALNKLIESVSYRKNLMDSTVLITHRDFLPAIEDAEESKDYVVAAVNRGQLALLKLILSKHPDYLHESFHGRTLLFRAVENNHGDIVKYLLENGAYPHSPNDEGIMPLEAATALKNEAIIAMLQNTAQAKMHR